MRHIDYRLDIAVRKHFGEGLEAQVGNKAPIQRRLAPVVLGAVVHQGISAFFEIPDTRIEKHMLVAVAKGDCQVHGGCWGPVLF